MAIQVRRGKESELDISKAVPGEWLVSTDTKYVRMCFAPGIVLRMATYEAFEADMAEIRNILTEARTIQEAVARIQTEINDTAIVVEDYAILAKSYAIGGTGTRENEDADNAKYYYEQAKHISQGGNGLVPLGTIAFENLPTEDILTNGMYNISNDFTSDNRFVDGGGVLYGKGSNVYYTVNGLWDVLAASDVKGVKGEAEDTFRQGNVTITPENLGLGNVLPLLGNTDISTIGDGTVTGGLSAVNENLTHERVPSNINSIVGLIGLVDDNTTKTFFIGTSTQLTDFPDSLKSVSAQNLVNIDISKSDTFAYIKINACQSSGVNYTLEGLYNGTALFWSKGDAGLNSDLEWKVKGTVQGTEILALPTSFRECVINGATSAEIDGITEYVNFPEILLLPNALDALPRRYFSTYRVSDTAYGYLAFRINSDKTVKIMAAYRNGEDVSSRVTWSIRYR